MWDNSRYGSDAMKQLWSDSHRAYIWRILWSNVLKYQRGRVLGAQEPQFIPFSVDIMLERVGEEGVAHELDALRGFLEEQNASMRYIHFGLTSSDIMDNADAIRVTQSVNLICKKLAHLIEKLALASFSAANVPVLGMTHLQPAEITSLGYRWLNHIQELYHIFETLPEQLAWFPLSKDRSGAVGSGINMDLFSADRNFNIFHNAVMQTWSHFNLPKLTANLTVSQTSSRANENKVLQQMSAISMALSRFAGNVRHLQMLGQICEPNLGKTRHVGSSAMPHKSNPILSENISGLSKLVVQLVTSHSIMCCDQLFERTLDDSSLRRQILPQIFLYVDEMLDKAIKIVTGWTFDMAQIVEHIEGNLESVYSSRLLLGLIMAYPDISRSELYERVQHSLKPKQSMLSIQDTMYHNFPDLRVYLVTNDMEDQFWDWRDLGPLPEYVAYRATAISHKTRAFLAKEEDYASSNPI